MTLVHTKLRLAQMAEGDTLEVLLCEGEPLENIPRSLQEQGYKVHSVKQYLSRPSLQDTPNVVYKIPSEWYCMVLISGLPLQYIFNTP